MRQTLGFIAVWCVATVLAVSVAWFGVRDVLRSEVFEDAGVEPLNAAIGRTGAERPPWPVTAPSSASGRTPEPRPASSASRSARPRPARSPSGSDAAPERTRRAEPRPGTSRAPTAPTASRAPTAPATSPPASRATRAATASPRAGAGPEATRTRSVSTENLRVMNVKGGSVSFAIENGVCRLVTAAPRAGYEAKVASAPGWIRVDLVRGEHGSAVFCIGAEGRTDLWEY